ncbi:hypothetical protein CEP52_007897 [Fusarium oligoseptatum]|uniref:Major facilitator superfamily (MFS) profile domain-containing protein n=1 Tax=Fusarium oligoseptatum TaxID=2604345 RepID=A0A428TKQ9_9HYPO|nr:hypothetical protein CEP52_007897 [Fusarium oligoseptatum]
MKTVKQRKDAAEGDQTHVRFEDIVGDDHTPWYRVPHLRTLNTIITVISMMNGVQSLPVWIQDFGHPKGAALSILTTAQSIGGVASMPIAPFLTDRLGRRHPIALGSIFCLIGTALQTASQSNGMFIAGRVLIGFGGGIVSNVAGPLLAELAYPSHRAFLTSFFNTSWYLGSIVAAWSTHGCLDIPNSWSWRIPSVLQAVPSIYQLAFIYLVPESPRWLVGRGELAKAKTIIAKYHAGGNDTSQIVTFQMAEIETAIEIEQQQNKRSYLDFFTTRGNKWRFAVVFLLSFMSQWAGNSLISYYLVIILNSIGIRDSYVQNLINGGLQIWNYFTGVIGAILVGRLGRRRIFLVCVASMAGAFLIWTILSAINEQRNFKDGSLGIGVVVMIFIYYGFYNCSFLPLTIGYSLEVLPFTL